MGSVDCREITRLLENTHYNRIRKTLEEIDIYGSQSGEIGESILVCNDQFVLSRLLAELSLFIHFYNKLRSNVTSIRRINNQKSPDIAVKLDDFEYLIEVFTPMDYYGYQVFSGLLISCLKNLDIDIGFILSIDSKAQNLGYTSDFPLFREIYDWIEKFRDNFFKWIKTAKKGDIYNIDSPSVSLKLKVQVESIEENAEIRSISWGQATRSTDTICFFRIDDPAKFSITQWGVKIKGKLQKQQAGEPRDKVLRILAINFSSADTDDLVWLNEQKYHDNFCKNMKYLARDITPYPPFDVVLPCKLGFECGFARPINLSTLRSSFIKKLLSAISLDEPIKAIPVASKEESESFFNSIIDLKDRKNLINT
ncbi:hypothetical protein KJ762_13150 [bacterium]|nr:hypothetical protein [bacterium]MBU1635438.1 hypothetical protein [bacterium]